MEGYKNAAFHDVNEKNESYCEVDTQSEVRGT